MRYSQMWLGNQVFTSGLAIPSIWTNYVQMVDVGMNWYLNKFVKVYFDWEHSIFLARPGGGQLERPALFHTTSDLFWLRFQFYY